jgi:hypothetical protein
MQKTYYKYEMTREVAHFLDNAEADPILFFEDAKRFIKNSKYKVSFVTDIDFNGEAEVSLIFVEHKYRDTDSVEFDRTKERVFPY